MTPANDPSVDYRALVRRGYDTCAQAYDSSRRTEPGTELEALTSRLQDGDAVLDIGCGAGVPIARSLARRCHVTGVDLSPEMVRRARRNVPGACFMCDDVMSVALPSASFDAAVAFYTVFHLPRDLHSELFHRVHRWLRPGGFLLCTLSAYSEDGYTEDDFFGVTMYWSNHGIHEYRELLTGIGFSLLHVTTTGHGYQEGEQPPERHPLVLARKDYISAGWYREPRVVPTWNYVAIHLHGTARLVSGDDEARRMVADFVDHFEAGSRHPWSIPDGEREFMDGLLNGIVAFTIDVERIEASWKLNQNHAPGRRQRVVEALRESGRPDELRIADLMQGPA